MARSDAVGKEPTIDEINAAETGKFKGLTMTDGEVSNGNQTKEEAEANERRAVLSLPLPQGRAPAVKVAGDSEVEETAETEEPDEAETPEDKAAREAREAKLTDKQKAALALQQKIGGDKKHYRNTAQERVQQAVARQREAERALATEQGKNAARFEALQRELDALKAGGLTTTTKPASVVDKDAPRATDYEFGELDAAFIRDVAVYETRKVLAAERAADTARSQNETQTRAQREFAAQVSKFEAAGSEKFDDFAEVVVQGAQADQWPLSKTVADLMFESEVGPDIAYYLATHVEEAKKIMAKSPNAQAAAFGRLEATFSSQSPDAANDETQRSAQPVIAAKTTRAPPPPQQRARGAGGKTQVSTESSDFAAVERAFWESQPRQ